MPPRPCCAVLCCARFKEIMAAAGETKELSCMEGGNGDYSTEAA